MRFHTSTTLIKVFLIAITLLAPLLVYGGAHAQNAVPSPTGHITEDTIPHGIGFKMFKIHQWNLLEIAKHDDDNNGSFESYVARPDFDMTIPSQAWSQEGITSVSFQEICRSTADAFAAANNINATNYQFIDYQGNTSDYLVQKGACQTKSGIANDTFGIVVFLRGDPISKQTFRYTGSAASSYGQRGVPCVKTRYQERVLTSCTQHTEFRNNAQDRFAVTRAETIQFRDFAESFAASSTASDHIFLPGDYNLSPIWRVNGNNGSTGSPLNDPNVLLGEKYHGYNIGATSGTISKYFRIDYIFMDWGLQHVEGVEPVCEGIGITDENSSPAYPNGDHCYIGEVGYELGLLNTNPPSSQDNIDTENDASVQNKNGIPGVPNAGNKLHDKTVLLVAGVGLVASASALLKRRKLRA